MNRDHERQERHTLNIMEVVEMKFLMPVKAVREQFSLIKNDRMEE